MAWHPFRNPGVKVLSVVLAALLWATVSRDQVVERSLRVPIEFQNIPDGLEIVSDTPTAADVRVRGTSSLLGRLQTGDVVAVLDLQTARPGERMFHLLADEVRTPFGITVTQVTPSTVSLSLEASGTKRVRVVPDLVGTPAAGFVLGKVTVAPGSVEVVGALSRLSQLEAATTEAVSIEGATAPIKDSVNVGLEDSALRLGSPQSAVVSVEIRPAPIERTFTQVAIGFRNMASGRTARVVPDTASVVVSGPGDAVATLDAAAIKPFVDLSRLGPGRYTLALMAEATGEVTVVRVEPERVTVRVR